MKKLMIAAAIVCAAALSQAASVSWQSGGLKTPGTDGTKTTTTAVGVKAYFFDLTSDTTGLYNTWAAMSYADASAAIWGKYGENLGTPVATSTVMGSANYSQTVDNQSGWHYGAVIYTYEDTDGNDWYIANIGKANVTGSGAVYAQNLSTTFGGTAGGTIAAWTAVPEPTSGLLLLLGVAGLALRRRRA